MLDGSWPRDCQDDCWVREMSRPNTAIWRENIMDRQSTQVSFGQHVSKLVEMIWRRWETPSWMKQLTCWWSTPERYHGSKSSVCSAPSWRGWPAAVSGICIWSTAWEVNSHIRAYQEEQDVTFQLPSSTREEKPKTNLQVVSLKNGCSLFSRLYIACQSRDCILHDFFCHENQPCLPSPSQW